MTILQNASYRRPHTIEGARCQIRRKIGVFRVQTIDSTCSSRDFGTGATAQPIPTLFGSVVPLPPCRKITARPRGMIGLGRRRPNFPSNLAANPFVLKRPRLLKRPFKISLSRDGHGQKTARNNRQGPNESDRVLGIDWRIETGFSDLPVHGNDVLKIYPFEGSEISLRGARRSARSSGALGAPSRSKLLRSRPL